LLAACRGMETSDFVKNDDGFDYSDQVKNACARCPVMVECRDYAVKHERYGYWGGTSPNQRASIRRRRRINLRSPQSILIAAERSAS
jgi:WhiB family redox-sensing transcriptional regulator